MYDLQQAMQHNLHVLGVGHELAQLARDFVRDYPDPYRLARTHAGEIVRQHTKKDWDPDRVWWHQFTGASTSSRSFNGWAHSGPPIKSLRLTELVIERFDLGFQDATDELDLYGGFYRQGPHAPWFDERNEVPMLAREVQRDFWRLDFAQLVRQQVNDFWATRSGDFQVLAKVNLLGQCVRALRDGTISAEDAALLRGLVNTALKPQGSVPTLKQLRQAAPQREVTVSACHPAGAGRVWMYVLALPSGRTVLYLPFDEQALRGFDSQQAMAGWFKAQLGSRDGLQHVLAGIVTDPQLTVETDDAREALQAIAQSRSEHEALGLLQRNYRPFSTDFFGHLGEDAAQNMRHNAEMLVDNHRLREGMFNGYLDVLLRFTFYLAPLCPSLPLAILGLSFGKLYVDVDLGLHARTREGREAALGAAIFDSIFAALGMVEVDTNASSTLKALSHQPAFHETGASLVGWQVAPAPEKVLVGQEANVVLAGKALGTDELTGIRLGPDGECWIDLAGLAYRVRYSSELKHWLIVDPDNPFAFAPMRPVRLSGTGEWKLLEPPRLKGGAPEDGLASEPSPFWDEYMRSDPQRSAAMSSEAYVRHKALLDAGDIASVPKGGKPLYDAQEYEYVEYEGVAHYTYREGTHYNNSLIDLYTYDDSINNYLRMGDQRGSPVSYLNKLATSMERLPRDAAVPLYRGGHGVRGTSGVHFRSGRFKVGDTLVNTDLSSFTENPYMMRKFAADPDDIASTGEHGVFDETSVVFELPAGAYSSGVPVTAFSNYKEEAETLFMPGAYFQIEHIGQITGADYRFVNVRLRQIPKPASGSVYDLRTGELFVRQAYVERLGNPQLVERFFPA